MWPNSGPGNAYRQAYGGSKDWPAKGYTFIDGGPYVQPSEDFTKQIAQFKKEGCEIMQGVMIDPDWTTFTKQGAQQGFKPKIMEGIIPTLFPTSMESYGKAGRRAVRRAVVPSDLPVQVVADRRDLPGDVRRLREGQGHAVAAVHHALRASANGLSTVFKRTTNIDDKEEFIKRVQETKMADSLAGPIDYTVPVQWGTSHPTLNCVTTPTYGGQWRLSNGGKYMFDLVVVSNVTDAGGQGAGQTETGDLGRIDTRLAAAARPRRGAHLHGAVARG